MTLKQENTFGLLDIGFFSCQNLKFRLGFNSHLFWEVWKVLMVVFGLVKGLASREPVVKGHMVS